MDAEGTSQRAVFDARTTDLVMDVVQSVNGGIVNVRRYPPGSAVMEMVLKRGLEAIATLFGVMETITFGASEGKLIVDESVMDDKIQKRGYVASFLQLLEQKNIRSLTLRRGMTSDELVRVLETLGATSDELRQIANLDEHLKAQGIAHVSVDEKVFVAVTRDQAVVDKAELERLLEGGGEIDVGRVNEGVFVEYLLRHLKIPGLDIAPEELKKLQRAEFPHVAQRIADALEAQAAGAVTRRDGQAFDEEGRAIPADEDPQTFQLMRTFERLSGSLVQIPNPAVRAKLLTDLTRIITSFKSATLANVLSKRMGGDAAKANLKGYVLAQADAEKKAAVIDQLLAKYHRALEGLSAEDFSVKFSDLKESERVLKALLARQRQAATPDLPPETVRKLEEAVAMVTRLAEEGGTAENLLLAKTKRLLAQPPSFFAQPAVAGNLGELVGRLLALNRPDLAKAVIDKLGSALGDGAPETRRGALTGMLGISRGLLASRYAVLLEDVMGAVLGGVGAETDPENLKLAQSAIVLYLGALLSEKKYAVVEQVLDLLREAQEGGSSAAHATFLADTVRLLSADAAVVKVLVDDVQSADETTAAGATRAVAALDPAVVVPPFVELLRTAEDRRVRKRCLAAIAKIGPPAVPLLREAARAPAETTPWYLLRNLLGALGEVAGAEAMDDLVAHMDHPDARVRKAVYQALMHVHDPKARRALDEGLGDEDLGVRRLIVAYLGGRHDPGTLDRLLALMEECAKSSDPGAPALQIEICHALGRIGDSRAVPDLLRMVRPDLLRALFRKRDDRLVEAAIRALGDLKAKNAVETLRRHEKDANPALVRAAKEALHKIEGG